MGTWARNNSWKYIKIGPEADDLPATPVTVEELSVTENDTYTAPEGKAYSPVTVNVAGGSSDFTTAEVTVTNATGDVVEFMVPTIDEEYNRSFGYVSLPDNTSDFTIILYKGKAYFSVWTETAKIGSVSGDITLDDNVYNAIITGDGTINLVTDE